jgi:hypothetical protein
VALRRAPPLKGQGGRGEEQEGKRPRSSILACHPAGTARGAIVAHLARRQHAVAASVADQSSQNTPELSTTGVAKDAVLRQILRVVPGVMGAGTSELAIRNVKVSVDEVSRLVVVSPAMTMAGRLRGYIGYATHDVWSLDDLHGGDRGRLGGRRDERLGGATGARGAGLGERADAARLTVEGS